MMNGLEVYERALNTREKLWMYVSTNRINFRLQETKTDALFPYVK